MAKPELILTKEQAIVAVGQVAFLLDLYNSFEVEIKDDLINWYALGRVLKAAGEAFQKVNPN